MNRRKPHLEFMNAMRRAGRSYNAFLTVGVRFLEQAELEYSEQADRLTPMIIVLSALLRRSGDDKAIQRVRHLDLARETRVRPRFESEVEHILLHLRGRPNGFR